MEAIGGLLIIPIVTVLIVISVLAFLMPYFVYQIAKQTKVNADELRKISAQIASLPTASLTAEGVNQARIQNTLLRQLLIAYGHAPDA